MDSWHETALGRSAEFIAGHGMLIIAVFAAAAVPFAFFVLNLDINNSSDIWFTDRDPNFRKYKDFLGEFGSDHVVVAAVVFDDVFSPEALARIDELSRAAAAVEHVEKVASLASLPVFRRVGPMTVPSRLLDRLPSTRGECDAIRETARRSGLAAGRLFSHDEKAAFLVVKVERMDIAGKKKLIADLEAALSIGGDVKMAGIPLLDAEFDRLSGKENRIFIPVSLGMVLLVVFLIFRSAGVSAACGVLMLLGLCFTIGTFSASGRTFNLMTSLVPPLLVSIGIADAIHILHHCSDGLRAGATKRQAIAEALKSLFAPCLCMSLTTSFGFLALVAAEVGPVREAGIFGAIGIMVAFFLAFTFFPALISFLPEKSLRPFPRPAPAAAAAPLERALASLFGFTLRHRFSVIAVSAVLCAASIAGMTMLEPETFVLNFFKKGNKVRADWEFIERKGAGLASAQILLRGAPGSFARPESLELISRLEKAVGRFDIVRTTTSAVDLLEHASTMTGHAAADFSVMADLLRLDARSGSRSLGEYLSEDLSLARISVDLKGASDKSNIAFIEGIERMYAAEFPGGPDLSVTGAAQVFSRLNQAIVRSQEKTALAASAAICISLIILLRSVFLGVLAMVPNVLPVLFTLGLMGWCGIPLDAGTMIIAGVALGISDDDTIHFLTCFRRESACGTGKIENLRKCYLTVGKAMISTSLILFLGFIVIGLSSFRPVYTFGILTGLTMALAIFGDLLLLPALIMILPGWLVGPPAVKAGESVPDPEKA